MRAHHEGWPPLHAGITDKRGQGRADEDMNERTLPKHVLHGRHQRGRLAGMSDAIACATPGFADREHDEQRQQQAWNAKNEEGHAPTILGSHMRAPVEADEQSERHPKRKDAKGRCARLGTKKIRDDGMRRRTAPRLTHANANARQRELPESLGHAADRGHDRPDRNRHGDDGLAIAAVSPDGDGNAKCRVKDGKGRPRQEAKRRIRHLELGLDEGHEHGQDHPVRIVAYIDDQQEQQDVDFVAGGIVLRSLGRRREATVRTHPVSSTCYLWL